MRHSSTPRAPLAIPGAPLTWPDYVAMGLCYAATAALGAMALYPRQCALFLIDTFGRCLELLAALA